MGKKIIFVSYGDSNDASSWSNIPFLFSKNLEQKGFNIIRLNINPHSYHEYFWNKFIFRFLNLFFRNHIYAFIRSWLYRRQIFKKIERIVKINNDAYFCIFLNFEFYNKFNDIPTLLFGDWTFELLIKDRLKRKPYFFEEWFINYQNEAIKTAELVVSLFKDCSENISTRYSREVKYLGSNVINDLNFESVSEYEILEKKKNSNNVLFIGAYKYLEGASKLIEAFKTLQDKNRDLHLNIIGLSREDLGLTGKLKNVHFYGYLRKDNLIDNKIYYDLLINSKVTVNPAENWAGYSSIIEAMKYFTPIIIKPYPTFTEDFGEQCNFGYYLKNTSIYSISEALSNVFYAENYLELCKNANDKVKDFTWDKYIEKLLVVMDEVKQL